MNAATKKKKTAGLSKGKLKKTIKNVLCRPDPIFWPVISEEKEKSLRVALNEYKIEIPAFTKPHWKILKQIPKEDRPKKPKLQKPEGLIFGVTACCEAVKTNNCSALIIESEVDPQLIVQPIIEASSTANVPIVCFKHLRELSVLNFGIKTICLGVKKNFLEDFANKITEIAKSLECAHVLKQKERESIKTQSHEIEMPEDARDTITTNLLLFRNGKRNRVFVPICNNGSKSVQQKLTGQDFIQFTQKTNKPNQERAQYKNMMLKRITNNPNRVKAGKKRKTEYTK